MQAERLQHEAQIHCLNRVTLWFGAGQLDHSTLSQQYQAAAVCHLELLDGRPHLADRHCISPECSGIYLGWKVTAICKHRAACHLREGFTANNIFTRCRRAKELPPRGKRIQGSNSETVHHCFKLFNRIGFDHGHLTAKGTDILCHTAPAPTIAKHDKPSAIDHQVGHPHDAFYVALADGVLHPNEIEFLRQVAAEFGFDQARFERIRASYAGKDASEAYEILGLKPGASEETIKKTYRNLIKENHPDRLIAKGMPQEFIDIANEKMAAINAAYDLVEKERGLK